MQEVALPCSILEALKFQSSEPHLQTLEILGVNMTRPDIGFPPIKIDSGENIHVITGVSGELLKVDNEINPIGSVSTPFPSPVTSSSIIGERWIGAWVERELRQARMAALDVNDEWVDGGSKAELRNGDLILHPSSKIWSQSLDSEPMGLSKVGDTLCFSAKNKGIYRIDTNSNEIWRTEHPKWNKIDENQDMIIGFVETKDGLIVISQAGGIAIYDSNGILIDKKIIQLPELITGFSFNEELGWFIKLNGKCFATMDSILGTPTIYRNKGPIYDAISKDNKWIWTGWRHDGSISEGSISTASRNDIGVGIIGDYVLTNDGTWDKIRI